MTLKEFLNHNRYQVVAQVLICLLLIWTFSCDSKVRSIINPDQNLTRRDLQTEVEFYLAQAEIRFAQLDRQDQLRKILFEHTTLWATTGAINPLGVFLALGTLAGLGATTDNVRRRIADKKKSPP